MSTRWAWPVLKWLDCRHLSRIGRSSIPVRADTSRLERMARDYEALRPTDIPVDRSQFEPSLSDFTRSGWAYFPIKDMNQLALSINRALDDLRMPAMPEVAAVQSIGFCNLRCPYCPTHGADEAHAVFQSKDWTMPDDLIRRIAHESFPYARQVSLSGGGENLLARNNEVVAELAHAYGCNIFVNSNGTVISKRRMRPLWGITHLRVSLDGATPETFEAMRLGAKFGKVMRNVRIMTRASELLPRSLRLQTAINFALGATNLRDLPLMAELARLIGIPHIYGLGIETTRLSLADEVYGQYPGLYRAQLERMTALAAELGVQLAMPPAEDVPADASQRPSGDRLVRPWLDDAYYASLPPLASLVDFADIDEEAVDLAEDALSAGLERMEGPLNHAAGEAIKRAEELKARQMESMSAAFGRLTPAEHAKLGSLKDSKNTAKYCPYLHRFLYYYTDGSLRPCCYEFVPAIGNMNDGKIADLFNGAVHATLSRRFATDDPDPSCAACPKWVRVPEHALFPFDATERRPQVHES